MTIPRDGGKIFSGELQVVGDNYNRWGCLLFFSIYAQNWQNIILGHLRTVNGELCGSYREKIIFKLKYNTKTWLKIFKNQNQYHEKQMHILYGVLESLYRC